MENNNIIRITDENGNSIELEVIAEIHNEDKNIDYVIYTDNIKDENGDLKYLASEIVYDENNNIKLKEVEDKELMDEIAAEIDRLTVNIDREN